MVVMFDFWAGFVWIFQIKLKAGQVEITCLMAKLESGLIHPRKPRESISSIWPEYHPSAAAANAGLLKLFDKLLGSFNRHTFREEMIIPAVTKRRMNMAVDDLQGIHLINKNLI